MHSPAQGRCGCGLPQGREGAVGMKGGALRDPTCPRVSPQAAPDHPWSLGAGQGRGAARAGGLSPSCWASPGSCILVCVPS